MRVPEFAPRGVSAALLCLSLFFGAGAAGAADAPPPPPAETLRPEVGLPLKAAQALMTEKKYKDALAKIKEAEAIPNRTPYENFTIDRMRGSAAANDGQDELALSSFEAVVASNKLPPADQLKLISAIAATYYNKEKNYTKAASWATRYLKEGGTDPVMQDLLINSYYLGGDYPSAINELKTLLENDEKAGHPTTEQHYLLLLSCYEKQKNSAGVGTMLEKLLETYPKKEYWDQAISHLVHRAAFAERLEFDLLRLRFALGDFKGEGDYMDMAQLAMDAGFPAEAKKVMDHGYANGTLGKGANTDRQKRLQTMVTKSAADDLKSLGDAEAEKSKTSDGQMNTGYNYVLNGKFDKGLPLMEQGLRKGGLKHPEDAKMHLGIAYIMAGEKAKAIQILRTVQGNDGVGDLAHLWAVYASR